MKIKENIKLAPYTTFKIGGPARYFCVVSDEKELVEAIRFTKEKKLRFFILGAGSNILISDDGFDGLVVKNEIKGIERKAKSKKQKAQSGKSTVEDDAEAILTVGAGEDWEELVKKTVEDGLYGLENLSSIPGTVGAAPVQNIGAYGVDASMMIQFVRALDTETVKFADLSNENCAFSYRDSLFKREKGRYAIASVTFVLSKNGRVNIEYKEVREYFAEKKNQNPSLAEVREAIVEIRKNKLPDWKHWGTAGSFFKNPVVSKESFAELKKKYPGLPGYPEPGDGVKVSLGWILDKVCDAKGLVMGNASTYEKQALVLVAKPGASSVEVVNLANELMRRVKEKTGIAIEGEVDWAVV